MEQQQMKEVNKSSNLYIGTTLAILFVIMIVGFVFG